MSFWDWISNAGTNAYNWAGDNPLAALSLGVGAAGTGLGIYDQYKAQQAAEQRQKLAESFLKMGPYAFAPNWSPAQLQAMYFRPAASFMQGQGITDGGAFRQALADAALKADSDRFQLGNQALGTRMQGLGYGPPPGATGTTGAFGQSLQNLMLMRALAARNEQAAAAASQGSMGGDAGRDRMAGVLDNSTWLYDNPPPQDYRLGPTGGSFNQGLNLNTQLGSGPFYPTGSMSELY